MIRDKKKPSPFSYKAEQVWMRQSRYPRDATVPKLKGDRVSFTDNAIAISEASPPPNKYNAYRSFTDTIPTNSTQKHLHFPRVSARKISKSPSCTDYELNEPDKKQSSKRKQPHWSFTKGTRRNSVEYSALKDKIPGVGHYKNIEAAFAILSSSPGGRKRI